MIEYKVLDCGIRLVSEYEPNEQAACIGVWVGAGSVCESRENNGVSHFIEHMFFKGTKTMNAYELAKAADDIGASINAFTGREATCYHIKALTEVFPKATEIVLDMLCNSVFDKTEMGRERGVIKEEMMMVEDTPDDYIIDVLADRVFIGTPLQKTIIGTKASLDRIKRDTILDYIDTWYKKDNIVVAVCGKFDEKTLISQINEYLGGIGEKSPEKAVLTAPGGRRFKSISKDINQSHLALGIPTISLKSEDYYAQSIVLDVLGGTMSSKLFQNVRERRGLCYTIYSAPMSYTDTGLMYIYAGVSLGKEKEALDAIAFELNDLADKGITEEELEIVKQRLKSGYIFSLERMNGRMHTLGKNRLLLGRNYTPEETMAEVDAVTMKQVNSYIASIADISKYSAACISKEKLDIEKMLR